MEARWEPVNGDTLAQGDLLPGLSVPILQPPGEDEPSEAEAKLFEYDLIVVTQTCDLSNARRTVVSLCPYHTVARWKQERGQLKESDLKEIAKGRREGLYLIPDPTFPRDLEAAIMVDLREVHTLPLKYVAHAAAEMGSRWRLRTPFLEHFSQAFGRTYMRVALPDAPAPFSADNAGA